VNEAGTSGGDAHRPVQVLSGDAVAADALERLGRSLGWRVARIDLAGCLDKQALLGCAAAALEFPGWFGRNWDAFYDCLADLGWRPGPGHLLVFEHTGDLLRTSPEVFETAVAILGEAAAAWERRGVPFRAFLLD
jgi:RNAse (barnase) inhibitor barstar